MYNRYNEDDYLLRLGRIANGCGLIGIVVGIMLSVLWNYSTPGIVFFALFAGYLGMSSFWGVYKLNRWFQRYKAKMPLSLWYLFRIGVWGAGTLVGILFYGAFQQFILTLALDDGSGKPGLIQSIIILMPYIGPKYADKINYNPHGRRH
ncbi:MAG: hypothetical protein ACQEQG_01765 [Bacillota bacterium]